MGPVADRGPERGRRDHDARAVARAGHRLLHPVRPDAAPVRGGGAPARAPRGRGGRHMSAALDRLGIELPVVQAGMGGGLARHELAAAVSEAGGLGTIGILDATSLRRELAAARRLTGKPLAVNLLLPFARDAHFDAAGEADVLVTFWGRPKRRTGGVWIHQCGSVE